MYQYHRADSRGNRSAYGAPYRYQKPAYNGGYQSRGQYNGPQKKRSGCASGMAKGNSNSPFVRGWNASKRHGLTSIIAGPYKGTGKHSSKSGRVWENWCAKVQVGRSKPYLTSCLYDFSTGRVIIAELGFVMNPKTNYCGTFSKRK